MLTVASRIRLTFAFPRDLRDLHTAGDLIFYLTRVCVRPSYEAWRDTCNEIASKWGCAIPTRSLRELIFFSRRSIPFPLIRRCSGPLTSIDYFRRDFFITRWYNLPRRDFTFNAKSRSLYLTSNQDIASRENIAGSFFFFSFFYTKSFQFYYVPAVRDENAENMEDIYLTDTNNIFIRINTHISTSRKEVLENETVRILRFF